jgi:hypothetical protein
LRSTHFVIHLDLGGPSQLATPDGSTDSTRIVEAAISPSILRPCGQKNAERRHVTLE